MDLEDEAFSIIKKNKEGIYQNVIWKELEIDSRKCSRIIKKLLDKKLIIRESAVANGARTYLLKAKDEAKEAYDLLLARDMFSTCTGCNVECQPEYCGRLTEWIGQLIIEDKEEVKVDEVKVDEVKVDEVKVDEVKVNEVKVNEVKVNEVKVNEVKVNEVKVDEVKVDEVKEKKA